jgi:hypothetical protein
VLQATAFEFGRGLAALGRLKLAGSQNSDVGDCSSEYGNYGIFPALDNLKYQRFDLCGKSFVRCTDRIGSGKKPSQLSARSRCNFRRVTFANAESGSARRFVLVNITGRAASASEGDIQKEKSKWSHKRCKVAEPRF